MPQSGNARPSISNLKWDVGLRHDETGAPQLEQFDSVSVLAFGREFEHLDQHRLEDLSEAMLEAAGTVDPPRLVIDLSQTTFFGSSFLELLYRAFEILSKREGSAFAISGLTPYCREVIDITHLDRLWKIYDTRDEAVNALQAEPHDG